MAVGSDPRICLSFLYKNDPFYSFCLSDLLTAPQRVRNKFLKEQRDLAVTLGKLEHQKLSRCRQLDEEKRNFYLLMLKKLSPKVATGRGSSSTSEAALSDVQFSPLALSKSSWKSLKTKLSTRQSATFCATVRNEFPTRHTPKFCKAPGSSFPNAVPADAYQHLPGKRHLARSGSDLPFFHHTMSSVTLCGTNKGD